MKRKTYLACMAILASLFGSALVNAAQEPRVRGFGQIDYFLKDSAYKEIENVLKKDMESDESFKSDVSAAIGVRVGAFLPTSVKGLEWGGSLGYLKGPAGKFTRGNNTEYFHDNYKTTFIRVLFEAQQRIPVSGAFEIRARAGLGLAKGKLKNDYYETDGSSGFSQSNTKSWTGLSWEVGPSVAYVGERVNVDFGVVLAGFPTMKKDNSKALSEFKWTPMGIRLAVEF
jgi:hypothetical protein